MLVAARTAAWSGKALPYDAEVEYLESTGTQYIDTEYTNPEVRTVECRCKFLYKKSELKGIFLTRSSNSCIIGYIQNYRDNVLSYCFTSSNSQIPEIKATYNNIHNAKIGNDGTYSYSEVDSIKKSYRKSGVFNVDSSIKLFSDDGNLFGTCKIYDWGMTINGYVVRDMLPVRFTNENGVLEGAMYDRVSGQLFRNAGTGAFIIGPDKTT